MGGLNGDDMLMNECRRDLNEIGCEDHSSNLGRYEWCLFCVHML